MVSSALAPGPPAALKSGACSTTIPLITPEQQAEVVRLRPSLEGHALTETAVGRYLLSIAWAFSSLRAMLPAPLQARPGAYLRRYHLGPATTCP